jgi:hypothetical protein
MYWYFWNEAGTHCISVRWEYGNHMDIKRSRGEPDAAQTKRAADLLSLWQSHFKIGEPALQQTDQND